MKSDGMKSLGDRITRLEHAEERTTTAINSLTTELRTIREQMQKWKGFIGGALFVVWAIWTMLQVGFSAVVQWAKSNGP